ncbi:MAG: hypothetical protein KME45_06315 [Stenomitos rutilans HA7619-LM2]|nr:hypothetical protein [Stenomitos rutilans HA7619-LM2]
MPLRQCTIAFPAHVACSSYDANVSSSPCTGYSHTTISFNDPERGKSDAWYRAIAH